MYRLGLLALAAFLFALPSWGGEVSREDFDNLKRELEQLRARAIAKQAPPTPTGPIGRADALLDNKYGPNAKVTTKTGRLSISGLLQVWSYSIQNDNVDYVADEMQTNELFDNDGYRIRRSEVKLSLDITEDITAVVMIDPTGGDEANTFPGIPSNQGVVGKGYVSGGSSITLEELEEFIGGGGDDNRYDVDIAIARAARRRMHEGFVRTNRVLQDAYINYHSPIIPHHDFTIGQFKAPSGEEAYRNSGQLDFVERAMINQFGNQRDLGIMVHGWWWNERFQYWIGGFNTAGSFQNTFASLQNRSDDNDAKDIAWRLQLRPLWRHEKFGSLEIGYARQDGVHGESGRGYIWDGAQVNTSVDGLSLQETHANRQYAWAWYRPNGPVRGWWIRGEWGSITDRLLPGLSATNPTEHHEANLVGRHARRPELDGDVPLAVFHLAAHANVRASFITPHAVLANNILGTSNLFEAVRLLKQDPVIQLCSTSEVYGQVTEEAITDNTKNVTTHDLSVNISQVWTQ